MTRVLALLMLAAAATLPPAHAQKTPAAPAGPRLHISAVAFDRDDRPVADLRASDMEVWIGGFRVPIETLTVIDSSTAGQPGRVIVLLLDDTTLPPALIPRVKDIARHFVDRLAPGDEMAVVALNGDAMESTGDRHVLLRSIEKVGLLQAAGVQRVDDVGAHVLKTVAVLSHQLLERPGGRKTIVGIGPARLFDTPIPNPIVGRDLRPEWTEAMRATASAGTHFYVIEPAGVGALPAFSGSSGFARETGGHTFLNTNDFSGAVDRIMDEASNHYLITVADPPVRRTSDLRELDVRVLRRGITVRTRRAIVGRP
jgi:VWFA-related protein